MGYRPMSFTEDELRAFNSILEQRLAAHRRDVEHMLDLRIQILRRDFEQRLIAMQQEIIRNLIQKLVDQQGALNEALNQKFGMQQASITQAMGKEFDCKQEQQQQRLSGLVDQSLTAQLLAIEQLLHQHLLPQSSNGAMIPAEQASQFEAIEVQTDLPWDDLLAIFGKALDERLATLKDSMQATIKDEEQHLAASFHVLASQLREEYAHVQPQSQSYTGDLTTLQEVFNSIEQLEHIVESMQVAMTNSHALLANRLFHHQQLPLERAHPVQQSQPPTIPGKQPNGTISHIVPAEQDGQ
jgi:hypothetical protein